MKLLKAVVLGLVFSVAIPKVVFANKANDILQSQSEKTRQATLTTFLKTSGEACDTVTRSFFQGIDKSTGAAFWNVACKDTHSYAIMVNNDATGSTKVLSCAMLKAVNASECFKKFKE